MTPLRWTSTSSLLDCPSASCVPSPLVGLCGGLACRVEQGPGVQSLRAWSADRRRREWAAMGVMSSAWRRSKSKKHEKYASHSSWRLPLAGINEDRAHPYPHPKSTTLIRISKVLHHFWLGWLGGLGWWLGRSGLGLGGLGRVEWVRWTCST